MKNTLEKFVYFLLKVDGNWITINGAHVFIPAKKFDSIKSANKDMKDDDIHQVIATDPTPNKEYSHWLARHVASGTVRLPEDSEKLSAQLAQFTSLKHSPAFRGEKDIGKLNPGSLYDLLQEHSKEASKKVASKEFGDLIYDKGDYRIYKIDPEKLGIDEAVRLLRNASSNTNWCTTQDSYARNYLKQGPTFIMFHEDKKYAQLHPRSEQFMDTKDVSLVE